MNRKLAMVMVACFVICTVAFSKVLASILPLAEAGQAGEVSFHGPVISAHKSGSLPVFPVPEPMESSGKEEVEFEDESDDELHKLVAALTSSQQPDHAKDQLFFQLQTSIENRPSVSLFVLYHCWKSFPTQIS